MRVHWRTVSAGKDKCLSGCSSPTLRQGLLQTWPNRNITNTALRLWRRQITFVDRFTNVDETLFQVHVLPAEGEYFADSQARHGHGDREHPHRFLQGLQECGQLLEGQYDRLAPALHRRHLYSPTRIGLQVSPFDGPLKRATHQVAKMNSCLPGEVLPRHLFGHTPLNVHATNV